MEFSLLRFSNLHILFYNIQAAFLFIKHEIFLENPMSFMKIRK